MSAVTPATQPLGIASLALREDRGGNTRVACAEGESCCRLNGKLWKKRRESFGHVADPDRPIGVNRHVLPSCVNREELALHQGGRRDDCPCRPIMIGTFWEIDNFPDGFASCEGAWLGWTAIHRSLGEGGAT